jgi:tetratricopeptide (TPR) repeat protein
LLGTAGVGKSRLVAEFIAAEEADATVLRGRCLSYGEGITYWPIGEIVRAAAGIDEADTADAARAKIGELLEGEREADVLATRVAAAVGLSAEPAPQEELFWAIRRLLEHLARERPLVVLIEDIHWAEPTLLDLLEHIADWSRDAPLLLLCPARPELLDARPGWGGGKLNATTILLEALPAEATGRLIASLPGGMALPEPVVERIQAAAEGNPLYVEELLAMLVDDGLLRQQPDATWQASETIADVRVPPTISALLAARLERLGPAERSVAEAASVIGRVFEQAAVSELAEDALRPEVARSLLALVRKELVRPDRSEITAGDAFKFRHMLIRDAAYEALPKAERAVLHERFADWLERTAGDRLTELEEIHGYHLERAHHYRIELGETGAQVEQLGARAGERFATAGMRAYERGDTNAAAGLLGSAVDLGGPNASPGLILEFGNAAARTSTGVGAGLEALARARDLGRAQGDRRVAALAECLIAMFAIDDGAPSAALIAAATSAIGVLEELGDGRELGRVEAMLGMGYWVQGSLAEAAAHYELGVAHSLAAGDQGRAILNAAVALGVLMEGPTHGAAVRSKAEALLEESPGRGDVRQFALSVLAEISAAEGDASGARNAMAEAIGIAIERGDLQSLGSHHAIASGIERMFSEPAAAVAHDRAALEVVRGGAAFWARASLARSLVDLGSNEEALQVTSQDTDRVDVMDPQVGSLHLRARALALGSLGQRDEAQQLARASIALVGATDAYPATGAALVDAGTVLGRGGEAREAQEYAKRAIAIYQTKGNVVMERKARELLEHPSR